MKEVYEDSMNVVIWLGEHDDFTLTAMSLVRQETRVARAEPNFDAEGNTRVPVGREEYPSDDLPAPADEIWDTLFTFYENVWFSRIWTIQEAIKQTSQMMMGSHEISLLDVCLASEWFFRKGTIYLDPRRVLALTPSFMLWGSRMGGPLLFLLASSSRREATDHRDKIYALLGLYSMWISLDGTTMPSFKPDYKKAVPEVYGDLVRYFLTLARA